MTSARNPRRRASAARQRPAADEGPATEPGQGRRPGQDLSWARPRRSRRQASAPAEDYLRESASPDTLPALISALDEVITMLTGAIRDAEPAISTPARRTPPAAGGARSHKRTPAHAQLRLDRARPVGPDSRGGIRWLTYDR